MEDILPMEMVPGVSEGAGAGWVGVVVDVESGVAMIKVAVDTAAGRAGFFVGAQAIMLLPKIIKMMILTVFQPDRNLA
jgi:hypothetical protein